jgi:predicted transcriptional regulator
VPVEVKGDEKIITKEVIKEVQVEVIKEVFNDEELNKLKDENEKLKTELEIIKKSLDVFSKGRYMKNSDLSSLYDE